MILLGRQLGLLQLLDVLLAGLLAWVSLLRQVLLSNSVVLIEAKGPVKT